MAKRILMPLSGRERDEAVLSLVGALSPESGVTVRLLRVSPIPEMILEPSGRVVAYVNQEMERLSSEGLADLKIAQLQLDGMPVERVVRFGEPVAEILHEAEAWGADLIVLTASRRGRLWSALFPGVADQVSRTAPTPTLILRV
jgi:nucleotide-binding universal stress UspA family protein